eukprot:379532_1
MSREVITVNVGECGIHVGNMIWDQYCTEYNITPDGIRADTSLQYNNAFFEETKSGVLIPRNLMIDLDPDIIDSIKQSKYKNIYPTEYILSGKQDAANNFARAHYTIGKEIIDKVTDTLRKLVNKCDNFQSFILNNAVGGGTGSGLGTLILERIAVDYRKKFKFGFHVYPFNDHHSKCVIEPYNALLSTH